MKKIKILKSEKSTYWYSENVGNIYIVDDRDSTHYRVLKCGEPSSLLISKQDCVIATEPMFKQGQWVISPVALKPNPLEILRVDPIIGKYIIIEPKDNWSGTFISFEDEYRWEIVDNVTVQLNIIKKEIYGT